MKSLLAVLSILLLAGCTTLKDARDARGTGVKKTFDKSYELVWQKSVEVIQESHLDLVSKDKEDGTILAQKGMSAFSHGENVAIFLNREGDSTIVEVVSKRAIATNITAKNWTSYIFQKLNEKLK